MARRKRQSKLRPKTPARVRKKQRARRRSRHHSELVGLGLVALAIFFAVVLWLGWDGGFVGANVLAAADWLVGDARLVLPLALGAVGGLMVARSELVDVRPFRLGGTVLLLGLMTALGEARGGAVGNFLEALLGPLLGDTGRLILAAVLLAAGTTLVTGAAVGALVRHSARAARGAARAARRSVAVSYTHLTLPTN